MSLAARLMLHRAARGVASQASALLARRLVRATAAAPFRSPAARRQPFATSNSNSGSGGGQQGGAPKVREAVPVTWTSLGLALAVGGGLVAYYQHEKHERQTQAMGKVVSYGKPALGGPFSLVTLDGVPVTDATYSDGYMLLYFGFT
jgi:protein SCO1/2